MPVFSFDAPLAGDLLRSSDASKTIDLRNLDHLSTIVHRARDVNHGSHHRVALYGVPMGIVNRPATNPRPIHPNPLWVRIAHGDIRNEKTHRTSVGLFISGVPTEIRTRVIAVKGRCPR